MHIYKRGKVISTEMEIQHAEFISNDWVFSLTHLYQRVQILVVTLIPLVVVGYIYFFQDPFLLFVDHEFHEIAIGIAIIQSGFIAYVTWRCYISSGEPLMRWLTLSFLGYTLIYGFHGILTPLSDNHMSLFQIYGPVSRLTLSICLIAGLLSYGRDCHPQINRTRGKFWLGWIVFFLTIDIVIACIQLIPPDCFQVIRITMEVTSASLMLGGIAYIFISRIQSWIMMIYMISLAYFAQGSLVFILAKPWNHLWWLAHLISASGFTILSYGVIRAFHATRAFSLVFSQEETMKQLADAKSHLEERVIERTEQLRQLAIEATLAEERERLAIARDLHDDLGQILHITKIRFDSLSKTLSCGLEVQVLELNSLIAEASRLVRSLTSQLAPPALYDFGLGPALLWLRDEMERNYGLVVEARIENIPIKLSHVKNSILFRAARELLFNVVKHSGAEIAIIEMFYLEGNLFLAVEDDGIGISNIPLAFTGNPGFGLSSVRERITFLGGSLDMNSKEAGGVRVVIKLPSESMGVADEEVNG